MQSVSTKTLKLGHRNNTNEPRHDKTNKMACVPSEDSDQPGHPPSLIRAFAVRMKKHWILKPRSRIACDCDAIALRPKNVTIAERSQRSRKGFIEVAKRSPIGRRIKLVASCLLSMHKRLTATNLVAQRFHRSPRGLKEVLCWSQIGIRQCGDRFHHEKGGDFRNVAATYLRLIGDEG